jgi:hypothetical protein
MLINNRKTSRGHPIYYTVYVCKFIDKNYLIVLHFLLIFIPASCQLSKIALFAFPFHPSLKFAVENPPAADYFKFNSQKCLALIKSLFSSSSGFEKLLCLHRSSPALSLISESDWKLKSWEGNKNKKNSRQNKAFQL